MLYPFRTYSMSNIELTVLILLVPDFVAVVFLVVPSWLHPGQITVILLLFRPYFCVPVVLNETYFRLGRDFGKGTANQS